MHLYIPTIFLSTCLSIDFCGILLFTACLFGKDREEKNRIKSGVVRLE